MGAAGCAAPGQAADRHETSDALTPATSPAGPSATTIPVGESGPLNDNVLVGFCGAPGSTALGRMTGDLDEAGAQLRRQAEQFASTKPFVRVVELIATTAHRAPGHDGLFRSRAANDTIERYLDHARGTQALPLLNIQPGRADFLTEVKAYERWLTELDIGVALDPEWAVSEGVVPGRKFGHTTGAELDTVAAYLGGLASRTRIPPVSQSGRL